MKPVQKHLLAWMVAALVILLFWRVSARIHERELSFSDFMAQLERGHVAKVIITGSSSGSQIVGEFKNGQSFRTFAPPQAPQLVSKLLEKNVVVNARDANSSSWLGHVISWTPIVIMIAFLIFFMRQMQGSSGVNHAEDRLRAKAQIHELLSRTGEPMSEQEMFEELSARESAELRIVLYEMLRDGTVVFTSDRKYRAKTGD
jgi:ATP-dependent Zn protease